MFAYTIIRNQEPGRTPFTARVLEIGTGKVEDFDTVPTAPWMQTQGDAVMAVNRRYSGAYYVAPTSLDALVQAEQKAQPCRCSQKGPDPACAKGQELWAAIPRAVAHAQFGREIGRAEGPQIDAVDAIEACDRAYVYHVESHN